MRRLLLQCGQRPGGLSFESPGSARGTEFRGRRIATLVRRGICRKVYHRASNMQKTVRRAPILWATDLQTGTGVKGAAGRRQICKVVPVLGPGVERRARLWLPGLGECWHVAAVRDMFRDMSTYIRYGRTDFSVVVKSRRLPPNPWRWEIYRAGKSSAVEQSTVFFPTMAAANRAGKEALAQLFKRLRIRAFD
jgi:hypothetical protein